MKRIFICSGELSGDKLGAGLIQAVKKIYPDVEFTGVAGPEMVAAGCKSVYSIDTLSVMGLLEVIPKLPKILFLRYRIIQRLLKNPPDIYIGIDAPDFNLPIEAKLKEKGIKTIHYVSPSVWAWRSGRVKHIKQAVDLLLCVFPFEKDFLAQQGIPVRYVGHRGADVLPHLYTQANARAQLQLDEQEKVITLLPGSRDAEIKRMMTPFLQTALRCWQKNKNIKFIVAATNKKTAIQIQSFIDKKPYPFSLTMTINNTYAAIKSADVVLATSGTVTLEAFLLDKPMVVAYKMNRLTWEIVRRAVKVKFCALPNLLAKKEIVPEFLQAQVTPQNLGRELMRWLDDPAAVATLHTQYQAILKELQCDADTKAAQAVVELLNAPQDKV
jgi:lipid-A-disaccharide synthase